MKRRSLPTPATQESVASASKSRRKIKGFANVFVLLAAAGIVGTIAIPAYAFNPTSQSHADSSSAVIDTMTKANAQSADVATDAVAPVAAHESFGATSIADIQGQKQAAANAAAAKKAAAKAASYTAAYSGPTAAQYLTQVPAGTSYSLADVLAKAKTYAGTPYVYGGATPAGFDCSGFVMFVYAQFGVSLPHSSSQQGHIGQTVSLADAQPGDVIALNDGSHVGFYAGTDSAGKVLIYDAPKPGGVVGERELWTTAYHIQHFGG
ncbi:C40 family peptidase [Gryllotalpicola daejeonensis]|uniref:C40 family peptidase n=1 Tax=Gryllotalpicola daejeonensis TaxID=993087 RepID=A0ABP7ZJ06_9MICO